MRLLLAVAAVLSACALAPAAATAGTVSFDGTTITVTGDPGPNSTSATRNGIADPPPGRYYFSDSITPLTAGPGCAPNAEYDDVQCDTGSETTPVVIDLGGGNDTGTISLAGVLRGGPGDDVLRGSAQGAQVIDGGDGNDQLEGDQGTFCSAGVLDPGAPDVLVGGPGVDLVLYDGNYPGLTVSIDDQANDGQVGEGDDVRTDVENLDVKSCGLNTITGSDGPNAITTQQGVIDGRGGDDAITTQSLDDRIAGGDGNDRLLAGSGNDAVDGGAGDDYLEGGFDDDTLTGGPGTDSLVGDTTATNTIGTGNDVIDADDGIKEPVSCGPGADVANLDALDDVPVDTQNLCETVNRSKSSTPAPGGGGPVARLVTVSKPKLTKRRSRLQLKVKCATTDKAGCNGTVSVKVKGAKKALASKSIGIAAGKTRTVTLKLGRKARKAVAKRKRTTLVVTTKLRTSAGRRTVTQTVTVRR